MKTMRIWRIAFAMLAALSLASCITINSSGYTSLSADQKARVVPCQDALEKLPNDGHIYLVTVEQLQQFLNNNDSVLIYEYLASCTSGHCVNPVMVEQDCNNHGVLFCIITESYDGIFALPKMEMPILAIDPKPFGKKITKECNKVFFNALTNSTWETRGYGRYYLFEKGKYVGCYNNYSEVIK